MKKKKEKELERNRSKMPINSIGKAYEKQCEEKSSAPLRSWYSRGRSMPMGKRNRPLVGGL